MIRQEALDAIMDLDRELVKLRAYCGVSPAETQRIGQEAIRICQSRIRKTYPADVVRGIANYYHRGGTASIEDIETQWKQEQLRSAFPWLFHD